MVIERAHKLLESAVFVCGFLGVLENLSFNS